MVAQPEKGQEEHIHPSSWASMLGDHKDRDGLVRGLSLGDVPKNLTHSVYKPLWPLINKLAVILLVDRRWIPESSVRKRPDYICEAFQRSIIQFIDKNRDKDFMTRRVAGSLRRVQRVPKTDRPTASPSQQRDGSDRAVKMKRSRPESFVCAIFEFLLFLLLYLQLTGRGR
jgi:hypothetical protein